MRFVSLAYDLILILLFALLSYWVMQQLLHSPPLRTSSPSLTPAITSSTDNLSEPFHWPIIPTPPPKLTPKPPEHIAQLINSIYDQNKVTRSYDPTYIKLAYPNGDVDNRTGVCTDVVIRAFRAQGIDLQQQVHEDMRKAFKTYPKKWGLRSPDPNIDHRRVPNLMTYFDRQGKALKPTDNPADYEAGDLVVWELPSGQEHIGIVLAERSADELRPLIGHNVGEGTNLEDVLFAWPIKGHYRYFDAKLTANSNKN